jgi:uncharacterized protein (TIGR03435 family)
MVAQTLLPFLALAVPGAFGQFGLYGPVTARPHAGDLAPDLTFTKMLSRPASDSWSPYNLGGQLTVLVFFPDTTHNPQMVDLWNAVVDKFAGKPVEFVWVTGECECTLGPWLQQHPIKGWVLLDREGKTGNAYGLEMPANAIVGEDRKIVGYFNGIQEIDSLIGAVQDGRITTTHPSQATLKAFIENKQVLIEAEPPRMPRVEDHKPPFPPSFTVHISPSQRSQSDGQGNFASDDYLSLQGYSLKDAIAFLYDFNPIRIELPAALDNGKRYDFSLVLPEPESREQMTDRFSKGLEDYFHVTVSREDRVVDVYVLSLEPNGKLPPAKPSRNEGMGGFGVSSSVAFEEPDSPDEAIAGMRPQPIGAIRGISADGTADELCHALERTLDRPVVNETNLKGEFVFRIEDSKGAENDFLKRLRDQLGLVITPAQKSVETLVLEPR